MKKATNTNAGVPSFLSMLLLLCFSSTIFSQDNQNTVPGKLRSDYANLESVSIQLKADPAKATWTDTRVSFPLLVPANGTLFFSSVGYETQEVSINGQRQLTILLKRRETGLNDFTIVGFDGTRRRANIVSACTTVDVKELRLPTANLTIAPAGRIPGMISFQQSGEPGYGHTFNPQQIT